MKGAYYKAVLQFYDVRIAAEEILERVDVIILVLDNRRRGGLGASANISWSSRLINTVL